MNHWFAPLPDEQRCALPMAALCALTDALGTPNFPQTLMSVIQARVPVFQIGISRLDADNTFRGLWHRCSIEGQDAHDRLRSGAREYAAKFYMSDPIARFIPPLREQARSGPMPVLLHRMSADEVPNRDWRASNYLSGGIVERLSIVSALPDDQVYAISLFRQAAEGFFAQDELDWFGAGAALLARLVVRHERAMRLPRPAQFPSAPIGEGLTVTPSALTPRESEVCSHLLQGMSYVEIGQVLGIGAESVRTYRNRAFAKLGISSRGELLALFAG